LLVHRRDDWLRRQAVVADQARHCVACGAVFQAHTTACDCAKSGVATGADAARTCVSVVKGQSDAVQVKRHCIAVERAAGAATDGRACGRQQAIVGFVGARDAGRGHELRGVDQFVHRRNDWLHRQAVVAGQTRHCVACCAVFQAHTTACDCAKSGVATGADAASASVCVVKGQSDAVQVKRHGIAVERAAGAAADG
jgi:hypothetical protein